MRELPGLRLHFYAVEPEPAFTLAYPVGMDPKQKEAAFKLFLATLDAIKAQARELARPARSITRW